MALLVTTKVPAPEIVPALQVKLPLVKMLPEVEMLPALAKLPFVVRLPVPAMVPLLVSATPAAVARSMFRFMVPPLVKPPVPVIVLPVL